MQRTVAPAPSRVAEQRRAAVRVDGDDLGVGRLDGQVGAGARLAADAEREPVARPRARRAARRSSNDDLVVLDRVDEPVAERVPDAEQLVEPGEPRAALVAVLPAK